MEQLDNILQITHIPIFYLKMGLGFLVSLLISFLCIPTVIRISHQKNLMDEPSIRSSHEYKIPNLGGIAIFFAIAITAPIFAYQLFDLYKFLFPSLVILIFIGVMDDIVVIRAYKKLIAQILVSFLMVVGSDTRITTLFGLFGIYELPYYVSVLISIGFFIVVINAYNLIDGIDGLGGGFVVLSSLIFSVCYFRLGIYNFPLVILGFILIGSVLGFLYFNLSRGSNKIFMGDSGSLLLGFLLAFIAICFINIFVYIHQEKPFYHLQTAPVIAIAILLYPLVDVVNVMVIRLSLRVSVFKADKNHIHHKLLRLGYSHIRSTCYILSYYLLVVTITYFCRHMEINQLLVLVLAFGLFGAYLPTLIYNIKHKNIKL